MSSSRTKREACPHEDTAAASGAADKQKPLQQSHRDQQARQLGQDRHPLRSTASPSQHPLQQLQPVNVSEAHALPLKHIPLQKQEEQRLHVQEESALRQQQQRVQRRDTADPSRETRRIEPVQARAGVTFNISAAAPADPRGSGGTHLQPTTSSQSHRETPSTNSRLGNSTRSSTNVRSHSGSAGAIDDRKTYRSSEGSTSSNATTASSGSTNSNSPARIKSSCQSSSGQSSGSTGDTPSATKNHQASEECFTMRSKSAAAAGASSTKREPTVGNTLGRSGRQESCGSETKKEEKITVAGKTGSHGEVDASSGRSTGGRYDSAAPRRQRGDRRDEGHSAEEGATGPEKDCSRDTTTDKTSRHIAIMCSPAAETDESKKKSKSSINTSFALSPRIGVTHAITAQHEQDTGRISRVQQQRYRLTLPTLRATTGPGAFALEKRRSSASVETTSPDAARSSRRGLQRSGGDRSSCSSTESSGMAHFGGREHGLIFPFGGAAAEGGSPSTAYASRIERGTAAEKEETGGMSARDAAISAAETLARKIRGHCRQRSASDQPVGFQISSRQDGYSEEQHVPAREHINSHWLWREFFLHALHCSNKGAMKVKQHAAETAAAAAHKVGHHFAAISGEGEEMRTTGVPAGAREQAAHADGSASVDSGVRPALAHAAFSSASGLAARHPYHTNKSAEPTSGSTAAAAAGKTAAGAHEVESVTERIGKHLRGDHASGHSVTTAILHSAVQAVKSLPYRLRREWIYLMRARKNSAHVNHTQRMQRAADVQHDLASAGFPTAEGDRSSAGVGEPPPAGAVATAAEQRGERGEAVGAPATRRGAVLQQQRYVDSMPTVAGRFYPKSQRERAGDLQALLHMHQVLPCRDTRVRLLQHVQRNIDKGRRDFEQASPLLSLRRDQLLPCGKSFIVRCLQQDSASVTRIHRKYLTAGRLIGGGSEAMVFAAVETPFPDLPPFRSRLGDLTWGRAPTEGTPRSVHSKHTLAPFLPTASASGTGTAALGGTDNAGSRSRNFAAPIGRAAETAGCNGVTGGTDTATAEARGASRPQRGAADEGQSQYGKSEEAKILLFRKGRTCAAPPLQGEHAKVCSRPLEGAALPAGTKGEAAFIEEKTALGGAGGHDRNRDVEEARTMSSGSSARQDWAICWALKWFLCEPFLLRSRTKAEQEGTVVDWLQMALWRLVPSDSINTDVIYELGIVAPQWIGFIEGMSLVCPGDARFALLNRVAAMPLMLGDLLTVPPSGLTVSDRLYCIMRLLQIVANLHAMGVLHNDIKMENILIGTDGTLHLGDLGSVTPFTGRPTRFQRIGTDVYLDPQTAQNFLEYERREYEQQNQQRQDLPQNAQREARGDAQQQGAFIVTGEAATPQRKPEAGIEAAGHAAGRRTLKQDSALEVKKAGTAAPNARNRRAGGANTSDVRECADGSIQEVHAAKETDAGRSEGRNRKVLKAQGRKADGSPFRIVYTPMRDAWAAGIVCYYIWCGGLLPYNLGRAFAGELTDHDLFEYLAQLPQFHKGSRLLFPLGSCPDGETEELLEVRRIIQGLLEPDGALRKTPLEIVQESLLFSAYRSSSFSTIKETRT